MANNDKYNARDYIYIVCKQARYIKQLRMSGPIIAPLKVQMATAWQIVCSGITLYQYNPPTKEFVLMTVQNAWYKTKFKQVASNKPSLLTSEANSTTATMSLKSVGPAEDNQTDDKQEVKEPAQNNSSNNKKKKNKNKQQYTAPSIDEVDGPKNDDAVKTEDNDVEKSEVDKTDDKVE